MVTERRVLLIGNSSNLMKDAIPYLAQSGVNPDGVVSTLSDVPRENDILVVIKADQLGTPTDVIEGLKDLPPARALVVIPSDWQTHQREFQNLPAIEKGLTGDLTWDEVARKVKALLDASPTPAEQPSQASASQPQEAKGDTRTASSQASRVSPRQRRKHRSGQASRPSVRVGFYGTRGGVGTSTAALTAAQALAESGQRVALFDATGRGDVHVMLGLRPSGQPMHQGNLYLFLDRPSEDAVLGFDAVIVDGGRERRDFNAEWIDVRKPLDQEKVWRLVGLEATGEEESAQPGHTSRRFELGQLFSIDIVD